MFDEWSFILPKLYSDLKFLFAFSMAVIFLFSSGKSIYDFFDCILHIFHFSRLLQYDYYQ